MKTIKAYILSLALTILVFSCGKETQATTQGGGLFKYRVTITPPLQFGKTGQFNTKSNNVFITVPSLGTGYQWNGDQMTSNYSTYESQEFSVTKGQNILFQVGIVNTYDLICRNVKIEALINGNVFKTVTQEKGYSSDSPLIKCKDFDAPTLNFIIP